MILGTADGKAIRFKETHVRAMGRTAGGVRGINLRKGDEVVDMALVDPTAALLTVCENGHGKRTSFDEYRLQSRGGYGIINIRTSERNGKVVGMKSIRDADELMLITSGGKIVRTGISELRTIGRATQGVRIISLRPDDKLVSVARVVAEDDSNAGLSPTTDDGAGPVRAAEAPTPANEAHPPADGDAEQPAGGDAAASGSGPSSRRPAPKEAEPSEPASSEAKHPKNSPAHADSTEAGPEGQTSDDGPDEDDNDVTIL